MTSDLVVVLPGIMGSTLAREGTEVWGTSRGALARAIRSLGASVRDLRPHPDLGDDDPRDGVEAVGLLSDLHVVPGLWSVSLGYDALLHRLRDVLTAGDPGIRRGQAPPNLVAFPYDWRVSNRLSGRRLKRVVEPALERLQARGGRFADARITFVCHSMGGLVARWYVEMEGGSATTRRLITIGTPHRGAVKALAELVNGARRGLGPCAIDFTDFARSLPAAYQLLPEYACIAADGQLLKTTETTIPQLDPQLVEDGARFHAQLDAAGADGRGDCELLPIVGTKQATVTTAEIAGERLELRETIGSEDEGGDATVPRLAATPATTPQDRGVVHWVAARHGALHCSPSVLDQLEGILTARSTIHRTAQRVEVGLRLPELVLSGEEIPLDAVVHGEDPGTLQAVVTDGRDTVVQRVRLATAHGERSARLRPQPPGGYVVTVAGHGRAASRVAPIASPLVVWEAA